MANANHEVVRNFLAALSSGDLPESMLADDFTVWMTSSGSHSDKNRYRGGVRLLSQAFVGGPRYAAETLTAEDDRVAIEATLSGELVGGEAYESRYVFILRIHDGRIASIAEHFHAIDVRDRIGPVLQAILAKSPQAARP
jgi:hypothetical protein